MKKSIFFHAVSLMLIGAMIFSFAACGKKADEKKAVPAASETVEETPEANYTISPAHTEASDPANWEIQWDIIADGEVVESYDRKDKISFGLPKDYTVHEGITTFRGNNYRNDAAYGTASVKEGKFEILWTNQTSSLGSWSGVGWTGQPLIVRWDDETKKVMNLYEEKQNKKGLVEAICSSLDGHLYFYDIEDGSKTRDAINVGMTFKGTGTLDPRGYPIMYIGSGIAGGGKDQRMFAVSLIDGSILYEQSGSDPQTFRSWPAFDSSPIIDAETDTLIWPGEMGILYTLKLNTKYDKKAGTISIDPEPLAKVRYQTSKSRTGNYWLGFEDSCVIVDRYLYISENGGMFFCIDLDTMELVWAQDTADDSNSTPVFEWGEDGNGYIYTAPSLHWTAVGGKGTVNAYKLNAVTGEIEWQVPYDCYTFPSLSGGMQGSPVLGRKGTDLEGVVIYPVAFCPGQSNGKLVALDTKTGDTVWEYAMPYYTWSSPVAVYTKKGKSYICVGDSEGNLALLDGKTGNVLDSINLGSNMEASPSVFEDTLVIGTRGCQIYGIKLK